MYVQTTALIVSWNEADVLLLPLSVTRTVKLYVPGVVAVPLSTPPELRLSPGGCVPLVIVQFVYGGVPPVAPNACEYVAPAVPAGSGEDVVIVRGVAVPV